MGLTEIEQIIDKNHAFLAVVGSKIGDTDMQLVLKKVFGGDVMLNNFKKPFFKVKGKEFFHTIIKFDVTMKKYVTSTPENYHMVAKMALPKQLPRRDFDFIHFKRERYFYQKIFPIYKQLEEIYNLRTNAFVSIAPTYFASYFPVNPKLSQEDGNAVLLLEDLETHGFYRFPENALDADHARVAIKFLAKFHAIGVKILEGGDNYNIYKEIFRYETIDPGICVRPLIQDAYLRKYAMRIKSSLIKHYQDPNGEIWKEPKILSICHANIGIIKNFLFHLSEDGKVDEAVILDFYNYRIACPLWDFICVILACLDDDVKSKRMPEMIDLYFNEFATNLKKLNSCKVLDLSRDYFDRQLRHTAIIGFPKLMMSERNEMFLRNNVGIYLQNKWLG